MTWVDVINQLVGSPFEWNGRGPIAFDCWGIAAEAFRLSGRVAPGDWMAEDAADAARLMESQIVLPSWALVREHPEPFDIAFMSTHKVFHHVGIVTPYGVLTTTRELGAVHETEARLKQRGYRRMEYYRWVG